MTHVEYYEMSNFLKIAEMADSYYLKTKSSHTYNKVDFDFDWFMRFYRASSNVSDKDIQDIWAKILADEIRNPSTYSYMTIDVLKNIGKKDAHLFDELLLHSFKLQNRWILPNYENYLKERNITYENIMHLSELNLLYNKSTLTLDVQICRENTFLTKNNDLIMLASPSNNKDEILKIKSYSFTTVGSELASIRDVVPNNDELVSLGKTLDVNTNIKIGVHRIIRIDDNGIEYAPENLLL